MGPLFAVLLELLTAEPTARVEAAFGGGFSLDGAAQTGGGIELGWLPLRWVRLELDGGGGYLSPGRGIVRLLAGADAVLPLAGGELFAGFAGGFVRTNLAHGGLVFPNCIGLSGPCDGFPNPPEWAWGPILRVRAGFDVLHFAPLVLGLEADYTFIGAPFFGLKSLELRARIGAAFW